jgi:hypothetical protein
MLFLREPFEDYIKRITSSAPRNYSLPECFQTNQSPIISDYLTCDWEIDNLAIDLITKMLCVDPQQRLDIDSILAHDWFKETEGSPSLAQQHQPLDKKYKKRLQSLKLLPGIRKLVREMRRPPPQLGAQASSSSFEDPYSSVMGLDEEEEDDQCCKDFFHAYTKDLKQGMTRNELEPVLIKLVRHESQGEQFSGNSDMHTEEEKQVDRDWAKDLPEAAQVYIERKTNELFGVMDIDRNGYVDYSEFRLFYREARSSTHQWQVARDRGLDEESKTPQLTRNVSVTIAMEVRSLSGAKRPLCNVEETGDIICDDPQDDGDAATADGDTLLRSDKRPRGGECTTDIIDTTSQVINMIQPQEIIRRDKIAYALYSIDISSWDGDGSIEYTLDTTSLLQHSATVTVSSNAAGKICEFCELHGKDKVLTATICCNYFGDSGDFCNLPLTPTVFFEPSGVNFCEESDDYYDASGAFAGVSVSLPSYVCPDFHWDDATADLNANSTVLTTTPLFRSKLASVTSPAEVPFDPSDWKVSDEDRAESFALTAGDESTSATLGRNDFSKHEILKRYDPYSMKRVVMFRINLIHFTGEVVIPLLGFAAGIALSAMPGWRPLFPWKFGRNSVIPREIPDGVSRLVNTTPREIMSQIFRKQGIPMDPMCPKKIGQIAAEIATEAKQLMADCGNTYQYHCFLSYRRSDYHTVNAFYFALISQGLDVFLDTVAIKQGEDWVEGFLRGLYNSRLFVPMISSQGLQKAKIEEDHSTDNLLLEFQTALRHDILIRPIYIGKRAGNHLTDFADFREAHYANNIT